MTQLNEVTFSGRRIKFPEGTIIICPNVDCCEYIGKFNRTVCAHDLKLSKDVDGIEYGASFMCPTCDAWYYRKIDGIDQLHTTDGWIG